MGNEPTRHRHNTSRCSKVCAPLCHRHPVSPWTSQVLYLIGGSAAGEEVAIIVTMQRDVENVGVSVEDLLSPVAVVNVLEGEELGKRSVLQSSG